MVGFCKLRFSKPYARKPTKESLVTVCVIWSSSLRVESAGSGVWGCGCLLHWEFGQHRSQAHLSSSHLCAVCVCTCARSAWVWNQSPIFFRVLGFRCVHHLLQWHKGLGFGFSVAPFVLCGLPPIISSSPVSAGHVPLQTFAGKTLLWLEQVFRHRLDWRWALIR